MSQLFIEFMYPGIIFGDTSSQPVSRIEKHPAMPKGAVAFRHFSRTEVKTEDGETLKGKDRDHTGWTYVGRMLTLADVKRETPDERILISNMEGNGYERVVRTASGNTFPLRDEDQVVAA